MPYSPYYDASKLATDSRITLVETSVEGLAHIEAGVAAAQTAADAASLAGLSAKLTPTTVKTANYTANPNEFIPVDATSGAFTITLPSAPADGTRVAVKKFDSSANAVTVLCTGADTINVPFGATSMTVQLQYTSVALQYQTSSDVWFVVVNDTPRVTLDGRYVQTTALDTDATLAANSDAKIASQKATKTYIVAGDAATLAAATNLSMPVSNTTLSKLDRVKRVIRRTQPSLAPSVMTSPPTITAQATGAVTSISSAVFIPITDNRVSMAFASRIATVYTAGLNDGVQRDFKKYSGQITGSDAPMNWRINTDAPQVDLVLAENSTVQIMVDGQLATSAATVTSVAGSSRYILKIVFSGRASREIAVVNNGALAGFYVGPLDTVWSSPTLDGMTVGFLGDSYFQASNTAGVTPYELTTMTALRLGGTRIWTDPTGGSGYVTSNAGVSPTTNYFQSRLGVSTLSTDNPDIHLTAGGINDAGTGGYAATVAAYYAALRTLFPTTVLVALGPWCPIGSNATNVGTKYPGIRDAIQAGIAAQSGPWVFIDNLLGTWVNSAGVTGFAGNTAWQSGSGKAGATTGSGNGDVYISSDGTHPSAAGYAYLQDRLVKSIRDGVLAL